MAETTRKEPTPSGGPPTGGPDEDSKRDRLDDAAKWLAGGFTIVTGVLTALGATSGGLERLLLNHKPAALFAFCAIAAAIALAVVALIGHWRLWVERSVLIAAAPIFGVGLVTATYLAVVAPSDEAEPAITASFKADPELGLILSAAVKAQHLPASTSAVMRVEGLSLEEGQRVPTVFVAQLGPDSDGAIDRDLEVPVLPGRFQEVAVTLDVHGIVETHCDLEHPNKSEGCVIIHVPNVSDRPHLFAEWTGTAEERVLAVTLVGRDLRSDQAVALRVMGSASASSTKFLDCWA